jgi:hypothetical protein
MLLGRLESHLKALMKIFDFNVCTLGPSPTCRINNILKIIFLFITSVSALQSSVGIILKELCQFCFARPYTLIAKNE